jgi:superfamily II DNA or RNA helicase
MGKFTGALPTWLRLLTDDALREQFGDVTFVRGREYAADGAVTALSTGNHGRILLATVLGSRGETYSTVVNAVDAAPGRPMRPVGRCSCPVQVDCKHVIGVVLTARGWLAQAEAPAPNWESQLADLVRAKPPAQPTVKLGLRFEIMTDKPSQYLPSPGLRVRLRPVVFGAAGKWVTAGVSWNDLDSPYGRLSVPPEQRDAVVAVLGLSRSRSSYYTYGHQQHLFLDELGARVWVALSHAQDLGVALMTGRRDARHVQVVSPVSVRLDLRRQGEESRLFVSLTWPDGSPLPDDALLVGDPAHGLVVDAADDERLLLAPLENTLDPAARRLLDHGPVPIPDTDLARFLAQYYPALRQRLTVVSSDDSVSLPEVRPPRLHLHAQFLPQHVLALDWFFVYGADEQVVRVPVGSTAGASADAVRDARAEGELLTRLQELGALRDVSALWADVSGQRTLRPAVQLTGLDTAAFATVTLPELLGGDAVEVRVSGERANYAETDAAPVIELATRDDPADPDWFNLQVDVRVGDEAVPLAPLITALARDEEHLLLESGTWFRLDRPELTSLRRLIEEARALVDRPSDGLRVTALQAGLWEELVELGVVTQQSARWQRSAGALLDAVDRPTPPVPAGLRATLRPYQLDGFHWLTMLWDLHLGGVLADDMGLGKTIQTLAMILRAKEEGTLSADTGPVLIVAPTSVVPTWAAEAAKFCPALTVVAVTETMRRSGWPVTKFAAGADVVVTSYALLRIDDDDYQAATWAGLVLDEAQFVKNHQAKTYQSARKLPAPFKLAITGTPLENSLMDLWSLLSITAPGLFPSPQRFTEHFRRPIESGDEPERLDTLRRRVRPFMLRRTKEQVASELPPKIEQVLEITLNPAHRRVYDRHLHRERQRVLKLVDDLDRNRFEILKSLTLLRQLSLDASLIDAEHAGTIRSSKIDTLVEHLQEVASEGHRALVFSQFTGFLGIVRARLDSEGITYSYLDGSTRDRARRIAEFTEGTAPVFLISLKAGGFGLTLTEADYVFVLDPWWNPAAEAQAVDRTHRIGQDKTVMVYRLVAADTIEEKVVALQQRKRDLFARVVDGGAYTDARLTAADIRGLFD